jgi:hypothetical protein
MRARFDVGSRSGEALFERSTDSDTDDIVTIVGSQFGISRIVRKFVCEFS